jgi:uncharacterized protein (DUF1684 family)
MRVYAAALLLALLLPPQSYKAEIDAFRKQREVQIGGETGWASLTDLIWLTKGDATVGRAASNAIALAAPSAPEHIGTLTVGEKDVTLRIADGVAARVKAKPVRDVRLVPDTPDADAVTIGGMNMAVIERGGKLGLRVWDRMSPARLAFKGLRWFPIDSAWRIEATFVPHQPAPKVPIMNILDQLVQMANPGTAVFTVGGHRYQLEALLESDDANVLFFMFKDGTSAKTTYGAGRYLYTPLPKGGHVTLDFNRAMNPPCAFTDFATCPLPPAKNRLDLAVEAGELNDGKE